MSVVAKPAIRGACLKFIDLDKSHSTSSEQIAEPDPFRFGSNFAHVFVGPKWEILNFWTPRPPPPPLRAILII